VADSVDITGLLKAWGGGDQAAFDQLMPLVYAQLRAQARRHMRNERSGLTLQSTALVHEVYLRLTKAQDVDWQDRVHFFALSAQIMRRILVDAARARAAVKRGGEAARRTLVGR
jgi:RNA polymerase sigma factor (TIGR02999 family)